MPQVRVSADERRSSPLFAVGGPSPRSVVGSRVGIGANVNVVVSFADVTDVGPLWFVVRRRPATAFDEKIRLFDAPAVEEDALANELRDRAKEVRSQ